MVQWGRVGSSPARGMCISIGCHFFPSLPNPGIFVFILLICRPEAGGSVTHLVYSVVVIHNELQNSRDSNPSLGYLLAEVHKTMWRASSPLFSSLSSRSVFQGCTCTSFSLTI
jgi:hypothetical protein